MERSKTLLNLTGFRAIGKLASVLAPHAYCFVALRGYPRHMTGILAALRDAVFFAPASICLGSTAMPPSISRHLTPHTSTQFMHPAHLLASTTGIHFSFMG